MNNREDNALGVAEGLGCGLGRQDGLESALTGAIFNAAVDSMLVINAHGIVQALNQATVQTFGFAEDELLGKNISMLMPEPHARAHDGYLHDYCAGGERKVIGIGREVTGRRKDGSCFALHLSVGEFQLGGQRLFVGICHDISERRKSTEHITFLAAHDALTGCVNRHHFLHSLGLGMQACKPAGRQLAVLFIDLDGFKQINDHHGHSVGDQVLKQAAERFQKNLRDTDMLGRVGGDEFVASLLLDGEVSRAEEIAERLIASLDAPFVIEGVCLLVRASIGISIYPGHCESADGLMNEADIAMFQSKVDGGNGICLFNQALREKSEQTYRVVSRLRKALELEQFELHYQLQVDLQTLQPSGMEALLRWRDGSRGLIAPGQFIPIALKYGLMPAIGQWVMRQACADNVWLIAEGLLDVAVAVNICAPMFSGVGFVPLVRQTLCDSDLPANRLEIEITEDVAMSPSAQVLQNAQELRAHGVLLAMDDFGVGFSSLGRLKSLRFNKLKIDRSFVSGLPGNASDQSIIHAILGIARGMQMETVAEGIETQEQLAYLQAEGCSQGQGFLFARPIPLVELTDVLRARKLRG
jgi:diguanylate cyclase (GGDEF)-like protein/PAS domain S-box-containing protein